MDHDIAGIDEDPLAMAQAFRGDLAVPRGFEPFEEALRQGHDLPLRAPRRNQEIIGNVGFSLEVDGDKVFGLAVFENFLGLGEKRLRRRLRFAARFRARAACCDGRHLTMEAPLRERISVAELESSRTGRNTQAGGIMQGKCRAGTRIRARAKRFAASSAKPLRQ